MNTLIRKTATGLVAAASLGAMVAATSTPAAAWGRHGWGPGPAIAAGVLGGLAIGAIAAGAAHPGYYPAPVYDPEPVYPAPVYGGPAAYAPDCRVERRAVFDRAGFYHGDRPVRVCD